MRAILEKGGCDGVAEDMHGFPRSDDDEIAAVGTIVEGIFFGI